MLKSGFRPIFVVALAIVLTIEMALQFQPAEASPFDQAQSLAGQQVSNADALSVGLQNLARYSAEINADTPPIGNDQSSAAALEDALQMTPEQVNKMSRAVRIGLISRMLLFGHVRRLKRTIQGLVKELSLPGDRESYTIRISPNPLPNASINPETGAMYINMGLIAFSKNLDEVADVIAHEMTHANPWQLQASKDNPQIEKVLNSLSGYSDLPPDQREEIRADLGATERMIHAGLNPWAGYDFHKRFAKWMGLNLDAKFIKKVVRLLMRRSFSYMEAHPAGEIRMAAIKMYILSESEKKDISQSLQGYHRFPLSLKILRLRANMLTKPLMSIWIQRLMYGYTGYTIANSIYQTILSIALTSNHAAHLIKTGGYLSSMKMTLGKLFAENWHLIAPLSHLAHATLQGLKLGVLFGIFPIMAMLWVYCIAQAPLLLYMGILHKIRSHPRYKDLQVVKTNVEKLQRGLILSVYRDKPDPMNLIRLLALGSSNLQKTVELYQSSGSIVDWRLTDGLRASRMALLLFVRNCLTAIGMAIGSETDRNRRSALITALQSALNKLPAYAFEKRGVLSLIQNLVFEYPELSYQTNAVFSPLPNEERYQFELRLQYLFKNSRELSDANKIRLASALLEIGMRDSALSLLLRCQTQFIRYVFSPQNQDKTLPAIISRLIAEGYRSGSLLPVSYWRRRLNDTRLLVESYKRTFSSPGQLGAMVALNRAVPIDPFYWNSLRSALNRNDTKLFRDTLNEFHSVSEVSQFVSTDMVGRNVMLNQFARDFVSVISKRPDFIQNQADIDALLNNSYFWPKFGDASNSPGVLEEMLVESMRRFAHKFPEIWQYDPASVEKYHALIVTRARELGLYPKDFDGQLAFWMQLTNRGVSSVSDSIFENLLETAPENRRNELERYALKEGRIWESEIKAKLARQQIFGSQDFKNLLHDTNEGSRQLLIKKLISQLNEYIPEHGIPYMSILEDLSVAINSSEEEARMIESAKTGDQTGGEKQEDLSLRVLSDMMETALTWSRKDQWNLILFLRGDVPATPLIRSAFRTIGTTRVQRMYQLLPTLAKTAILDSFLDAPKGLLPKMRTSFGWGSTVLNYLMRGKSKAEVEVAKQVLSAFLYSLRATGNRAMQSYVLSYLLALPNSANESAGQTLKNILEIFGATGIKIGQFLVASGLLPEKETEELRSLQERAKIPERYQIYKDLREILGKGDLPFAVRNLLGAASLKYAFLASELKSQEDVVMKVFRLEAIAHTQLEFNLLDKMADYLVRRFGVRYGVFRSIVTASREAVKRELKAAEEVKKSQIARQSIYVNLTKDKIHVSVPQEILLNPRLIAAQYAKGVSFYDIRPEFQALIAQQILEMESNNLFSNADKIKFDPDRHAGNYRIFIEHYGQDQYLVLESADISPIDFGQLLTVTKAQKENIIRLFALAQIAKKAGSSDWLAASISQLIPMDEHRLKKLRTALKTYFPNPNLQPVTAYYSLLAALETALAEPLDIVYFDYVRAIIQLRQYEKYVHPSQSAITPSQRFEALVREQAAQYQSGIHLTISEKVGFAIHSLWHQLKDEFHTHKNAPTSELAPQTAPPEATAEITREATPHVQPAAVLVGPAPNHQCSWVFSSSAVNSPASNGD